MMKSRALLKVGIAAAIAAIAIWACLRSRGGAKSHLPVAVIPSSGTRVRTGIVLERVPETGICGKVDSLSGTVCVECAGPDCPATDTRACAAVGRDGRYCINSQPGRHTVFASAEGRVPQNRVVEVLPRKVLQNVNFRLATGGATIKGRIVARDESAIPNGIIDTWAADFHSVIAADEKGVFAVSVPARSAALVVGAPGFGSASVETDAPSDLGAITLGREAEISGNVLTEDTRVPVPDVDVYLRSAAELAGGPRSMKTSQSGEFAFSGLAAGGHILFARGKNGNSLPLNVVTTEGIATSHIVLELRRGVRVTAQVIIANTGAPCPAPTARISGPGGVVEGIFNGAKLEFPAVSAGIYRVFVRCEGYTQADPQERIVLDQGHTDFQWFVEEAYRISGHVTFLGKGSATGWIEARREGGEKLGQAIDERGDFSLNGLVAGDYVVVPKIASQGAALAPPQHCTLSSGSKTAGLSFIAAAGADIRTKCSAVPGGEGLRMFARDASGVNTLAEGDVDERQVIRGLPGGEYEFFVGDGRNAPFQISRTITVNAGDKMELPCSMPTTQRTIFGHVSDDTGTPVGDAWVQALPGPDSVAGLPSPSRVPTKSDGAFAISGLADEEFIVVAERGSVQARQVTRSGHLIDIVLPRPASLHMTFNFARKPADTELRVALRYTEAGNNVERRYYPAVARLDLLEIPSGAFDLELDAGGQRTATPLTLAPGESRDISIVLGGNGG